MKSKLTLKGRFKHSLAARLQPVYKAVEHENERARIHAEGLDHVPSIKTATTPGELRALEVIARSLPRGAVAVEIGSYLGASTCHIAAGLRAVGGHLTCVDTWNNETMPDGVQDTMEIFLGNTRGFAGLLTLIRKRSDEVAAAELPSPIDFAFIDGDHSYEAVVNDIRLLTPLVKPGGIIAFHDTKYYAGVSRAVGELLAAGEFSLSGVCNNLAWLSRSGFRA